MANNCTVIETTSTSKVLRNCERRVLEYGKTISNYMLCTGTGTLYMLGPSWIMFCPCPSPIFKMNTSEILYKTESSFEIMLYELKMSRKWQTFCLLLIYLKRSTEQKGHFIKLWYLKWKGVDRDRPLKLLSLNWTADVSWYSW